MATTDVRLESKAVWSWVHIWARTNFSQFLVRDVPGDAKTTYVLFIFDRRRRLPRADLIEYYEVRGYFCARLHTSYLVFFPIFLEASGITRATPFVLSVCCFHL